MEDYCNMKRGQIPAFGNWDYCDEMPITQYFDSAMQAGSIRGSHPYFAAAAAAAAAAGADNEDDDAASDLFKVPSTPPSKPPPHHHRKVRKSGGGGGGGEKSMAREKQLRKQQGKVYDLTNNQSQNPNPKMITAAAAAVTTKPKPKGAPKAVDEDLYKIPPEFYQKPKKKRLLRNLWSGCVGLSCIA